jgi:hypothetical protein
MWHSPVVSSRWRNQPTNTNMTETTTKQTFDYLVTFWNGSTVIIKAKTNTQARQIAKQITRRTISATRIA